MARSVTCRICGHVATRGTEPESWRCPQHPEVALVAPHVLAEFADYAPLLGRVLGGKYHLVDVLGRGGFGAVYRALQAPVGRPVAVKVIREGDLSRESQHELRGRFMREARVISALRHHATVKLHDFGEDGNVLFMVLELVEGQTLHRMLGRRGPMPPERAVQIMVQVLEALAEAHRLGMVHRDLKPGNVMLSRSPFGNDRVKVLDFGIAKIVDSGPGDGVETSRGVVFGSPAYMAPEQAQGEPVAASDLYAAGVMLYEMLTGVRPFQGENEVKTVLAHIREPIPDGMERAGVPQPLADVVRHALAKEPAERLVSAQAMAAALLEAVDIGPLEDGPTQVNLPLDALRLPPTEQVRVAPVDDFDDRPTTIASVPPAHLDAVDTAVHSEFEAEQTLLDPAIITSDDPLPLELAPAGRRRVWLGVTLAAIVAGALSAVLVWRSIGSDPAEAPASTASDVPLTAAPASAAPEPAAPAPSKPEPAPPEPAPPEPVTPPSVALESTAPPVAPASMASAAPATVSAPAPVPAAVQSAAAPASAAPTTRAPAKGRRSRTRRRPPRRPRRAPRVQPASSGTEGWL